MCFYDFFMWNIKMYIVLTLGSKIVGKHFDLKILFRLSEWIV